MQRRRFLKAAVASPLLISSSSTQPCAGDDLQGRQSIIVDTHLHCFAGQDDPRFPYHPDAPYQPGEPATPEHLLRCMAEAEVDYAIVVHPEPYQDDHRYLEHCLNVGRGRLKGTCLFFADKPGSLNALTALVERLEGQIVASRIHAYAPDRLPPFGTEELRALWKRAGELDLAVQLHFEPRYAPGFEPLIKEFPETTVIIDHMGRPFQGTPDEHAVVIAWARFPNTILKLSSLPDRTQYPHRDIAPVIRSLTKAYGADRFIYGGGFNAGATGATYRAYRERLRSYLNHLSEVDQAKILGKNAARLFGFGGPGA